MAKIRLEKFDGQYVLTVLVSDNDKICIDNIHKNPSAWTPASIIAKGNLEAIIIKGENNETNSKK